ncbi:hypothetical protein BpHYR1_026874 [Brachionus plicatilis]|uniref:Uncharacterized protein n=1 Tax=Brachionus plicatilis TaxID=10195 RepID=A0A3M7RCY8_BRAPC|nr:hypothetical protein BpHYR1_026874 [Brachionus plicatilis]
MPTFCHYFPLYLCLGAELSLSIVLVSFVNMSINCHSKSLTSSECKSFRVMFRPTILATCICVVFGSRWASTITTRQVAKG